MDYDKWIEELSKKDDFDEKDRVIISLLKLCKTNNESDRLFKELTDLDDTIIALYKQKDELYQDLIIDMMKLIPNRKKKKISYLVDIVLDNQEV